MTGGTNDGWDKCQVGQMTGQINDAFYVLVGQMTHFMYRSDKCGKWTNVVIRQMSGWTNVGWTNVGRTKVGAPTFISNIHAML